jgi:hypothetical protein
MKKSRLDLSMVLCTIGVILLIFGGVIDQFYAPGSLIALILSLLGCGLIILVAGLIIYEICAVYHLIPVPRQYAD